MPGWVWGLGGVLALVCLVVVVVGVVIPALGNQMQGQLEGAMATIRPTSRPAATAAPFFSQTPTAPPSQPTAVPEEPTPTLAPEPPPSHWEVEERSLGLMHGSHAIIASGTGDFLVTFNMILADEGAGDGQINFNVQGPSESQIVGIELSTGKYAVQGGAGTAAWEVSDAIKTDIDATNNVAIVGRDDTLAVVINGEVLAEFDHPTTGVGNFVYLTVYHDVFVHILEIHAEGLD